MIATRVIAVIREHRNDVDHPDEEGTEVEWCEFRFRSEAERWVRSELAAYDGPHSRVSYAQEEEWDDEFRCWVAGDGAIMNYAHGDDEIRWYS